MWPQASRPSRQLRVWQTRQAGAKCEGGVWISLRKALSQRYPLSNGAAVSSQRHQLSKFVNITPPATPSWVKAQVGKGGRPPHVVQWLPSAPIPRAVGGRKLADTEQGSCGVEGFGGLQKGLQHAS